MSDDAPKGMTTIRYLKEDDSADPDWLSPVTYVAAFNPDDQAELDASMLEVPINSVKEACEAHGVRVRGQFEGLNDEVVTVDAAATDENTFTPDGLTRIPEVRQLYVRARTYEGCKQLLSRKGVDRLSEDEVAELRAIKALLEQSLGGVA